MSRVFVSSVGAVTPAGIGVEKLYNSIFLGKSMITNTSLHINSEGISSNVSGFCKIDEQDSIFQKAFQNKKEYNRMDKFLKLALLALEDAVRSFDIATFINDGLFDKNRVGCLLGCGIGGLGILENAFAAIEVTDNKVGSSRRVSPFTIPYGIINMASSLIAMKYDLRGPTFGISSACASGNHSIAVGFEMIKSGALDIVIAGGTEAAVTRVGVGSFDAMRSLSTKYNDTPERASRPFDKNRDGFVISEGAGILILESEESLKRRNGKALAEVKSVAMSSLVSHITSPDEDGDGAAHILQTLLQNAKIDPCDVDAINMHATSTQIGDPIEAKAIRRVFRGHYPSLSATKSITGHMLGAVAAVEAIIAIEMINRGSVPPNLNLDDIDDFALDMNLSRDVVKKDCNNIISNAFGFGGTSAGVLLSKVR